jgi:hypothetical protein
MSDQSLLGSATSEPAPARKANLWSALIVALVCATVAYITHQIIHRAPAHPPRRLWTPIVVTAAGAETTLAAATRRLEFWTPSSRTKDHLAREGAAIRERDKWEAITSDEPVHQFGALLRTNANVLGYRRAEVWGHGSTVLKPGWWWTMTVTTNYSVQNLLSTYRGFWKSTNAVFVERIENPGEE